MKSLTILFGIFLFTSCAVYQKADPSTLPPWSEVIEIQMKKDDIFTKSRAWFVQYYVSSKAVLQMEDRAGGVLMGKAHAPINWSGLAGSNVEYVLKIEIKDSKYRISIDRICGVSADPRYNWTRCGDEMYETEVQGAKTHFEKIVKDHKAYLVQGKASDF